MSTQDGSWPYPEPREPYAWEIEQEEQAEYEAYCREVLKDTL